MSRFIEIPIIHPSNVEGDTKMYVNAASIVEVVAATPMDRRQRNETRCIIMRADHSGIATTLTAEQVMELINMADMDLPRS